MTEPAYLTRKAGSFIVDPDTGVRTPIGEEARPQPPALSPGAPPPSDPVDPPSSEPVGDGEPKKRK